MIHGDCSSAGCYAMTDEQIAEIYALAREAFFGGQRSFQVQAYPFRMTPLNMARYRNSPHMAFWRMLKQATTILKSRGKSPRSMSAIAATCSMRNRPAILAPPSSVRPTVCCRRSRQPFTTRSGRMRRSSRSLSFVEYLRLRPQPEGTAA